MNQLWIDQKYASIISSSLEQVKDRSNNRFRLNFRCPFCGDSHKSKFKTRGWLYENQEALHFNCFNCGTTASFSYFLNSINPVLYKEYCVERFGKTSKTISTIKMEQPVFEKKLSVLPECSSISSLDDRHYAKKYMVDRKIPTKFLDDFYFVEKFFEWTNKNIDPSKFVDIIKDESRIVFPLRNRDGDIFGIQGRALGPSKTKYITIRLNETEPKIYGLDRHNPSKKTFVLEGPIDSLFLPNAIAMVGADANLDQILNKESTIIVLDNEPRSREIVNRLHKYMSSGWKICLFPTTFNFKDINDAIMAGLTSDMIVEIIESNSWSGLEAALQLKFWSKI